MINDPILRRRLGGDEFEGNVFADLIPGASANPTAAPAYVSAPVSTGSAKTLKGFAGLAASAIEKARNNGSLPPPPPAYVAPVPAPPPVVAAPVAAPVVTAPTVAPAPAPVVTAAPGSTATPTATATPVAAMPTLPPVVQIVRDTPGYQFQVQGGLDAVNANAYARGLGNSGVTFKALQEHGRKVADQYYQQYLANVAAVAEQGRGAAGAVAGAGNQMGAGVAGALGNQAQAYQNAANAAANSAYQRANITSSAVGSAAGALGNIGGALLASSYGK